MSTDTYVVLRAYGAAGAVMTASDAVKHGEITPEAEKRIVGAARLQSGEIDARAIDVMEGFAKQFGRLAATMRATREAEAKPRIKLADYPLTPKELEQVPVTGYDLENNMAEVLSYAIRNDQPLSMSHGVTILGGRKCEDGSYEAIVAVHHFMSEPTEQDPRYRVKSDGKGGAATVTPINVG